MLFEKDRITFIEKLESYIILAVEYKNHAVQYETRRMVHMHSGVNLKSRISQRVGECSD